MRTVQASYGRAILWLLGIWIFQSCCCAASNAQGGPPYYTNDPGTPGNRNWEINLGYMPFLYNAESITHTPDVDINYGVGDRIQLTFENAWLRVKTAPDNAKYGLGQDQLGVKWRFYDDEKTGLGISAVSYTHLDPQAKKATPQNSTDFRR